MLKKKLIVFASISTLALSAIPTYGATTLFYEKFGDWENSSSKTFDSGQYSKWDGLSLSSLTNSSDSSGSALQVKTKLKMNYRKEINTSWKGQFYGKFSKKRSVTLSYRINFSSSFNFGQGAKLPGLTGGSSLDDVKYYGSGGGSGGGGGGKGWSTRYMWSNRGGSDPYDYEYGDSTNCTSAAPYGYVYHDDQPDNYGEYMDTTSDIERSHMVHFQTDCKVLQWRRRGIDRLQYQERWRL